MELKAPITFSPSLAPLKVNISHDVLQYAICRDAPEKRGGHIKIMISQRPPWAISGITECFHGQRDRQLHLRVSLKYQTGKLLKQANCLSS